MITSNGSPQDYGIYSNLNFTFEECLDYCNEDERCMMIYEFGSTVCQVFEIGEVTSVKRNNDIGKRFGYKIADSKNPTCPGGDTVGGEGHYFGTNETSGRQIYQSYTIKMCPHERFKMFLRAEGPWCLVVMSSLTIAFFFTDPFLSENPIGFLWNPNQPDGTSNDCLVWRKNPDGSSGIDDVPNTVDNSTCFNEYMCGQPPT
ncbi:hypothetical protein L5515_002474 [Caenorhabditis briggsae]|uniref:PAN-3 domain-containing protein n=1 Tax=Caenorhabditis briggsae TaxID=6238 RepID=A0AAE9E683_CAEBR|nr:hypothetical protein L5515_002474 [Caenorhabditis briggsae]